MNDRQDNLPPRDIRSLATNLPGQVVLVLQGGGALGSYQAGVYQALHEAGIEPDWIIGTSIGAINASLIAGNEPDHRLSKLKEFWKRMEQNPIGSVREPYASFNEKLSYWSTIANGIPGFFRPTRWRMPAIPFRLARKMQLTIRPRRFRKRLPNSSISI
jgi:NTE family protein